MWSTSFERTEKVNWKNVFFFFVPEDESMNSLRNASETKLVAIHSPTIVHWHSRQMSKALREIRISFDYIHRGKKRCFKSNHFLRWTTKFDENSFEIFFVLSIRFTILSIIRIKSINPIHIKQQLAMMNPETRVIIVHTTS